MVSKDRDFSQWTEEAVAIEHNKMNKEYFDKNTASTYPTFQFLAKEFHFMLGSSKDKRTCIDIGCGAGWQAVYLDWVGIGKTLSYHGTDVSEHMCNFAKKNYPKGTYETADVFSLPDKPKYDIVMACGVIEHFEDWEDFVRKCCDLSNDWVLFHKIFVHDKKTNLIVREAYDGQKEYRVYINRQDLESEFHRNGFSMETEYDWDGHVFSTIARRKK